jgi:two-component system KDP operon response regulator KdpE
MVDKRRILCIEDEPEMIDLIRLILERKGFEVLGAVGGQEGLDAIRREKPDLVLLDLMMPDVDGWQVCKAIRQTSNVPILVLSALNDPRMVASVLDAGADDFLVKPVPSGVLVANIRKLIRRNTGALDAAKLKKNNKFPRTEQPLPSRL